MRWPVKPQAKRYDTWERWYAWRPIKVPMKCEPGYYDQTQLEWVWLEWIERRQIIQMSDSWRLAHTIETAYR